MIKIELIITEGDAELKMDAEEVSVADLQSAICNVELIKMNLIGQLQSLTEIKYK